MDYTKIFILINYLIGLTWCNISLEPEWTTLNVGAYEKWFLEPQNPFNSSKSLFGLKGLIN